MDEIHVQVSAVCESLEDCLLGDLMEDHPSGLHLWLQNLDKVPADAFSLAVLISCQYQFVGSLELALDLGDDLLLGLVYHIFRLVAVSHINAKVVLRKRPDMAVAGHYRAVRTEEASDRLGLGRRLDYYNLLLSHYALLSWK